MEYYSMENFVRLFFIFNHKRFAFAEQAINHCLLNQKHPLLRNIRKAHQAINRHLLQKFHFHHDKVKFVQFFFLNRFLPINFIYYFSRSPDVLCDVPPLASYLRFRT